MFFMTTDLIDAVCQNMAFPYYYKGFYSFVT